MTSSELVEITMSTLSQYVAFITPIIGVLAGANFIFGWLNRTLFKDYYRS